MRVTLLLAVVTCMAVSQETQPTSRQLADSRPASPSAAESRHGSLRELVQSVTDAFHVFSDEDARASAAAKLTGEGWKAWREGRTEEAKQIFERLRRPPYSGTLGTISMVSVLIEEGALDAAADVAEEFAALPHDEDDERMACWLVAYTNEKRGNWTKALAAWEKQKPSADPAAMTGGAIYRLLAIARCRFKLGEVDVALELVERCLKDEAVMTPFYDGGPSHADAASGACAEYAARGDRLVRARAFVAGLREPLRSKCRNAIQIVEGWLTKDPESVLRAVAGITVDEHIDLAGRLLGEMGDPAIGLLAARIQAGDVVAIQVAACSRRPELLPALEKRQAVDGPDEEAVAEAIEQLERVTARSESRLASRTASRPGR